MEGVYIRIGGTVDSPEESSLFGLNSFTFDILYRGGSDSRNFFSFSKGRPATELKSMKANTKIMGNPIFFLFTNHLILLKIIFPFRSECESRVKQVSEERLRNYSEVGK